MRYLAIGIAGAAGALMRAAVGTLGTRWTPGAFPAGTWIGNILGCFVLAWLYARISEGRLPQSWRIPIGTGFLGAFTTFSTFSVESVTLAQDGRYGLAAAYVISSVAGGIAGALLGDWSARAGRSEVEPR